jgi:hypothetical protein
MTRSMQLLVALVALLELAGGSQAAAQERKARSWTEEKCARYHRAWADALARRGTQGLRRDFIERHEAFLASGCTGPADVCPRSTEEFDLANAMVVAAMNAGTASTFPPFACRGGQRNPDTKSP